MLSTDCLFKEPAEPFLNHHVDGLGLFSLIPFLASYIKQPFWCRWLSVSSLCSERKNFLPRPLSYKNSHHYSGNWYHQLLISILSDCPSVRIADNLVVHKPRANSSIVSYSNNAISSAVCAPVGLDDVRCSLSTTTRILEVGN